MTRQKDNRRSIIEVTSGKGTIWNLIGVLVEGRWTDSGPDASCMATATHVPSQGDIHITARSPTYNATVLVWLRMIVSEERRSWGIEVARSRRFVVCLFFVSRCV